MRALPATVDDYIDAFPPDVRARLAAMRATIRQAAPEATERISYGMPAFQLHGNLVYFAAYAHHVGFYATPTGVSEFRERLAPYRTGKGSIQLPHDQPLPLDLVADIVRFRVARNAQRSAGGARRRPVRP